MYVLDLKCSSLLLHLSKSERSVWESSLWCNAFSWESNEDFYLVILKTLHSLLYTHRGTPAVHVIHVDKQWSIINTTYIASTGLGCILFGASFDWLKNRKSAVGVWLKTFTKCNLIFETFFQCGYVVTWKVPFFSNSLSYGTSTIILSERTKFYHLYNEL